MQEELRSSYGKYGRVALQSSFYYFSLSPFIFFFLPSFLFTFLQSWTLIMAERYCIILSGGEWADSTERHYCVHTSRLQFHYAMITSSIANEGPPSFLTRNRRGKTRDLHVQGIATWLHILLPSSRLHRGQCSAGNYAVLDDNSVVEWKYTKLLRLCDVIRERSMDRITSRSLRAWSWGSSMAIDTFLVICKYRDVYGWSSVLGNYWQASRSFKNYYIVVGRNVRLWLYEIFMADEAYLTNIEKCVTDRRSVIL